MLAELIAVGCWPTHAECSLCGDATIVFPHNNHVTRSDKRVTKWQFGLSEFLTPTKRAIKELSFDISFTTAHNWNSLPVSLRHLPTSAYAS